MFLSRHQNASEGNNVQTGNKSLLKLDKIEMISSDDNETN